MTSGEVGNQLSIYQRYMPEERRYFLCFVDRASRYDRVMKKKQLDAQLIPNIFRQSLHVSGVSRPIISRYNRIYTTIVTYYCF